MHVRGMRLVSVQQMGTGMVEVRYDIERDAVPSMATVRENPVAERDAVSAPGADAQVSLRSVDRINWRDVTNLKVTEAQREFVAEPAYYLALCTYGGDWHALAVYVDERVVGFMMWAIDPADGSCWLGGIVIDQREQRRGYGSRAVLAAIDQLAGEHGCHAFALSYHPTNLAARSAYATLGFVETGEREGDEVVARLSRQA